MKRSLLIIALPLLLPAAALAQTAAPMAGGSATPATPSTMGSGTMGSGTMGSGTMGSGTMGSDSTTSSGTGMSSTGKLSMMDEKFIKMAAISGMAEVNDGKLASTMGATDMVKNVGMTMVTDHTKVNNELMALAQQKGVTVPASVDAKHAAMSAGLAKMSGASFDHVYLHEQLLGHEKAIALFKTEASAGSDPDLKSFASSNLPTLEQHLTMIKAAMK